MLKNSQQSIEIRGARVHNLKNISVSIPKNKLVVITGLSGSGKSSLAFDTLYAEGQRRYAESLSSYARQFLDSHDKPDVDEIQGLSPTIAIDQRSNTQNPRSTVGTVTEIYDYLRLLFSRLGGVMCPDCKMPAQGFTSGQIIESVRRMVNEGHAVRVLAPLYRLQKEPWESYEEAVQQARATLDTKLVRFDRHYYTIEEFLSLVPNPSVPHMLEIVVAEFQTSKKEKTDLTGSIERALEFGNGLVIVDHFQNHHEMLFSVEPRCPRCGKRFPPLEPRSFSFNSPHGACSRCMGLGVTLEVDKDLVIPNPRLTLAQGAIQPWMRITGNQQWYTHLLHAMAGAQHISMDTPVEQLPRKVLQMVMNGTGKQVYEVDGKQVLFEGVITNLMMRHRETTSDYVRKEIEEYMREQTCSLCNGDRLKQESLEVRVFEKNIAEICALPIDEAVVFLRSITHGQGEKRGKTTTLGVASLGEQVSTPLIKEMLKRLTALERVGLTYVSLNRAMHTLSGGEAQRVRLSTQLSTGLTGVIYVLDEPSIGLHPRDMDKLVDTLMELRDLGNTVVVVEHDEAIMRRADYIIDVGPGAGVYGGKLIAQGTPAEIMKDKASITGAFLSRREEIECAHTRRKGNGKMLTIEKATAFNLKNITVDLPLARLVCVTGVSGSGKSSLIIDVLSKALTKHFYHAKEAPAAHAGIKGLEHIDKVIAIDQTPIGRTPRSNPATYTGVFTAIRDVFAALPEARMRGYAAGKFSFNVKGGGRCEACAGDGYTQIPMQFLSDVFVECPECNGKRYNNEALEIHYNGKNIADVLKMTVEEARRFFSTIPAIYEKLQILNEVGLGYLELGQPATTLSGGEAQRVKLATELSRRSTGKTLYILDEPTTGLHLADIKQLLGVLNQLVDRGNTVLIIEHNIEVIKCADWIIDLGPEGGVRGGEVVAEGTPEQIAKNKRSVTSGYLKSFCKK